MKRELAITGIAIIVSILLSSPSLAQTSPTPNATPAPAPIEAEPEPILSLDELVQGEFAAEDRARMLLKCIGPRPMPLPADMAAPRHAPEATATAAS